VSTFDNLKTGCKPDAQRLLTTCQPIAQKICSAKIEFIESKYKDLSVYFHAIIFECMI
jgi:hypothetical protein